MYIYICMILYIYICKITHRYIYIDSHMYSHMCYMYIYIYIYNHTYKYTLDMYMLVFHPLDLHIHVDQLDRWRQGQGQGCETLHQKHCRRGDSRETARVDGALWHHPGSDWFGDFSFLYVQIPSKKMGWYPLDPLGSSWYVPIFLGAFNLKSTNLAWGHFEVWWGNGEEPWRGLRGDVQHGGGHQSHRGAERTGARGQSVERGLLGTPGKRWESGWHRQREAWRHKEKESW